MKRKIENLRPTTTEVDFSNASFVFHESIEIFHKELSRIARKHNLSSKGEKTVMVAMKIPMLIEWKSSTHSDDTYIMRFIDDTDTLKDLYHEGMGKEELVESKEYVKEILKQFS